MSTPKAIVDAVAALRAERMPIVSRLDAIDLAIENLSRVFPIAASVPTAARRKKKPVRRAGAGDGAAATRRDLLLAAITRSEVGMTLAELRKATPKMDGKDRSNALQTLKSAGTIRRVGNAWRAA